MYSKSYKTLTKEIKDDTNKWKDTLCSWIRTDIVKLTLLPKTVYRFNTIPIKMPMESFTELELFLWRHRRTRIANTLLKQKNKVKNWHHSTLRLMKKQQESRQCEVDKRTDKKFSGMEHRVQK